MRSKPSHPAGFAALAAVGLALASCSPSGPPGVDRAKLDEEVSRAIGDPATCVLIGKKGSGKLLYRYNSATTCGRTLPACDRPERITLTDLLDATAKDGRPRRLSCDTAPDHSKGVGWASGPIEGTDWVYAAVMEGNRVFPGLMMADRLDGAFRRAGVSKPAQAPSS
ncbi:MAG: hypothetical protein GC203_06430 [Phenylobacterium sp.]|uniref:hypothetical protein n=1 Tax=Phenylobacterium sp. TaxID=1871053 RepID=UPI0025E08A8A|nr:hypothetical protein [Phenylobacterium sp.]MBI1197482.1 hypothetical protein [Phenylobacterium sp.]